MKEQRWYIHRVRAMSGKEILWRVGQKLLQRKEKKTMFARKLPVTAVPLRPQIAVMTPGIHRMAIDWKNQNGTVFEKLDLFDTFDYQRYKKKWSAGFQTEKSWPEEAFSYDISCSQREDIGDIRTNWELNRHFQFAALAKSYYMTGRDQYFFELRDLFGDWNQHNLFLHGVQWISAMESAIRINSWIYTLCFLEKAGERYGSQRQIEGLSRQLCHGILVMTQHITRHYARFSSANNHLIVEMSAVAQAGILFDCSEWRDFAFSVLTRELPRQNSADGINQEMSLHYQGFVMEAYGLLMLQMNHNHMAIPSIWIEYLSKMSEFLCDCRGRWRETVVFGDSDEGKLLDLSGKAFDYYQYVLDLMGLVLPERYSELNDLHENLLWCSTESLRETAKRKNCYCSPKARHYQGGYTLLRSSDHRFLIGVDHAELGFGRLAAHGHGDALSFQLFFDGIPVFLDPGTYNYHSSKKMRDDFRRTSSHNTLCVDGGDQAEIRGPFLWGKPYECGKAEFREMDRDHYYLRGEIRYDGITHTRVFDIDLRKDCIISITDHISAEKAVNKAWQTFLMPDGGQDLESCIPGGPYEVTMDSSGETYTENCSYSPAYNQLKQGMKICFAVTAHDGKELKIHTRIRVKDRKADEYRKDQKNQ